MKTRKPTFAIALVSLLFLAANTAAADEPLATLRLQSLDAALDDTETVAAALDLPIDRDQLLGMAMSPLGLSEDDWLDRSRPIAVALPMQGMMLGAQGVVAALPIREPEAAIAALGDLFATHETVDGQHSFTREDGTTLVVEIHEDYLLASLNGSMLRGFDLDGALAVGDLPPGNLSLDLDIEPLAPVLQAGLEQGRQLVKQQVAAEAGSDEEAEVDPATMGPLLDLYFDLLQDAIRNVRRIQISLEVTERHGIFHKRLLPIPGSTLAGFAAAQKGGMPEVARLVDQPRSFASAVSNLTPTPESNAALAGYFRSYLGGVRQLLESAGEDSFAEHIGPLMAAMEPAIENWMLCQRGDFAAAFSLEPGAGMRITEILGAADTDACTTTISQAVQIVNGLAAPRDGERWITMTENALTHGGVEAVRQEVRLGALPQPGGEKEEESRQAMLALFGDRLESYAGIQRDLILVTGGVDAEQRFKELADRAKKTKKWMKSSGGLTADSFAPLEVGPGIFFAVDFGSIFKTIAETLGDEGDDEFAALTGLEDGAGRITYGARVTEGSLTFEVALPFEMIRAFRSIAQDDDDEEAAVADDVEDAS